MHSSVGLASKQTYFGLQLYQCFTDENKDNAFNDSLHIPLVTIQVLPPESLIII